jgi:hypothetical protein
LYSSVEMLQRNWYKNRIQGSTLSPPPLFQPAERALFLPASPPTHQPKILSKILQDKSVAFLLLLASTSSWSNVCCSVGLLLLLVLQSWLLALSILFLSR